MTATLQWLDLTSTDRDKVRRVLDLFHEQGTVDELGLGSLRDLLSDTLFPGTSVLHTRLRYTLFIPWLYQRIEQGAAGGDIRSAARNMEIGLIDALAEKELTGVIGINARASLSRLPSSVYWAALSRWDIFRPAKSQSWYHSNFDELQREARRRHQTTDDPGVSLDIRQIWHPRLPLAPKGFPGQADFSLRAEEASFLQAQISAACGGTLLAHLADNPGQSLPESLWDDTLIKSVPESIYRVLELARQFSVVVEGAPLLYNLMLAERRGRKNESSDDDELAADYQRQLGEWLGRAGSDLSDFDPKMLWRFSQDLGVRVDYRQKEFVEAWLNGTRDKRLQSIVDSDELRRLIADRERRLKGPGRARLSNVGRLANWSGRVGVGRMEFRWPQVRRLMMDLYEGLAR